MLIRAARNIVLALVLSFTATSTNAIAQDATIGQTQGLQQPVVDPPQNPPSQNPPLPLQGTVADQTSELQKLRERVGIIEGQMQGLNQAITASTQSTNLFTEYVTLGVTAVIGIFTILGSIAAYIFNRAVKQMGAAREQLAKEAKAGGKRAEQIENELSSTIWIARTVLALGRHDQATDKFVKRLYAGEAHFYITQAESKKDKDSHLLNWKAYTLKRMGDLKGALEAAQEALTCAETTDPQRVRALYNTACYLALSGPERYEEALDFLNRAIIANELYKSIARLAEEDFDSIRSDPTFGPRFKQMVE